ncbi:MAG TPA: hypothetical protein DDZ89_10640 [Clostridiales bacterium]|nr:hypothetical protein [Clostridiales bacterium]
MVEYIKEPGVICFLFSSRYWREDEIKKAYQESIKLFDPKTRVTMVKDEEGLEQFLPNAKGKGTVLIPMSGGVQPWMLKIGKAARFVVIAQGYFKGFFNDDIREKMVENNAPPALADAYAVLKRMGVQTELAYTKEQVNTILKANAVLASLHEATILCAGEPEPWVISSVRSGKKIEEKFGIRTKTITLDQLEERYHNVDADVAQKIAEQWSDGAECILEPDKEAVFKAAKLQTAVTDLMQEYNADCFCAKCFELIGKIDTTACLALSSLNSSGEVCGACEGDLDSAVSLMIMKRLTGKNPWMANPIVLEKDKLVLAHCSSPIRGEEPYEYKLRSHHESGTGVSTQVTVPVQKTVTLMRIGDNMEHIQFFTGIAESQPDIKTCRTRLQIHVDGLEKHVEKALGCHYIMVYGDVRSELSVFAKMAKLNIV